MTTYTVQGPSGKSYTIDGPEGATADQLGQVILSQSHDERVASEYAKGRAEYNPTNDMGTGERLFAGIGRGVASVGRGLAGVFGQQSAEDTAEAKRVDAPLMATTAGKVGNALGQAAVTAPALLAAPEMAALGAAAPYVGAAMVGGAAGALTTEGGLKDRALGAAGGAAGGVVGVGAGQLLGAGAKAVRSKLAANALEDAPRVAKVQAAQDAGYVLPPNELNPDLKNAITQAWSGPVKTTQAVAAKNQVVTNAKVASELGLPEGAVITPQALNDVRASAGQAYNGVKTAGTITPTPAYEAKLDAIVAPFKTASAGFPNAKANPVIAEIESLKSPQFDSSAAISKIGEVREMADAAYLRGDKSLGKAYKEAATAIEDQIDQHLVATGAPADTLQAFRDARTTIAKTYDVQKALKGENVDAHVLAGIEKKSPGRLSGGLADIANTATNFRKSMAMPKEAPSPYSAVDGFGSLSSVGTAAALHNPLAMLPAVGIAARPLVRGAALSPAGQSFGRSQVGPTVANALALGVQSPALQRLGRVGATIGGANLLAAEAAK